MKISRHLLFLLFFSFFIGSIGFDCFAQTTDQSTSQLNKQMKSFMGRLRVYSKCLRRKGTTEECKVASKAALKDGAILIVSLVALVSISYLSYPFLKSITPLMPLMMTKNIPQKYKSLAATVTNIEAGIPLTAKTAKEWVQLYEKIHNYEAYNFFGWGGIPEDVGASKSYAQKIRALGNQIYKLYVARKIKYADRNAQIIIEDIFLWKHFILSDKSKVIPPFPI